MYLPTKKIPVRFMIAFMIFSTFGMNYMMRVNLSVNLVAMVPVGNHTYSNSQTTLNWTAYERAQVLSGFFWGYICGNFVGGTIAELLGPRISTSVTLFTCSLFTLLSPVAAKFSYLALFVVRILLGLASGILFPTLHVLISKWAVPAEKGRFFGALIGGTISIFFAWIICGLVIEPFGWEWGFYIFGIIGYIWLLINWNVVYDSPEKHPRISNEELHYIRDGLSDTKTDRLVAPYLEIIKTIPFWSLCVLNFGNGWGLYFVITAIPNYLATALNYKVSSTGIVSALIYLIRSLAAFLFGYMGDLTLNKGIVSVRMLRRIAIIVSHVLPGCIVLCMAIPGYGPVFYVTLMMIAMGFNGSVTLSSVANPHDLSKNFVGSLTGISGVVTTAAGAISPYVTAYFTKDDETNQELWRPVFYVGGLLYIMSGLLFLVFGSTERQAWDTIQETRVNEKEINLS